MMFSCNNTNMIGKSWKQDTTLCVVLNDMLNDLKIEPNPEMPMDCAYYLRCGNELSRYRINTFMDFYSRKVYKIVELQNYANLFDDKNDTSTVVANDRPAQVYFNTDYEKNILIRKDVLDSVTSKHRFADTCTVLMDMTLGGRATIEITNEYLKRDSTIAVAFNHNDLSVLSNGGEDNPKKYIRKILAISSSIDKQCLSEIIKNSRMVKNWEEALRPYDLYLADMKLNDVRIMPTSDFLKTNAVKETDDLPRCVILCRDLNLIFIRK